MKIYAAVVNDKGRVRKNNEDNFLLNGTYMKRGEMDLGAALNIMCEDDCQIYAVCDGMGGTDAGEEASYRAVRDIAKRKKLYDILMIPEKMISLLQHISNKIYNEAQERGQESGTTIVLMVVKGHKAIFSNVGDSRIYLYRNQKLTQITRDHSQIQRLISMGMLTEEEARRDPRRHVITQYMGMPEEIQVAPYIISDHTLLPGDMYLLCSDGLTDMVENPDIAKMLNEQGSVEELSSKLLKRALENGGRDNTTVMLVKIAEDNPFPEDAEEDAFYEEENEPTIDASVPSIDHSEPTIVPVPPAVGQNTGKGTSIVKGLFSAGQFITGAEALITLLDLIWGLVH